MFLKIAIMLKGFLALIKAWFRAFSFIIIDILAILTGVYLAKRFWSIWYFQTEFYYPSPIIWSNALIYTGVWIFAFFIQGVYETKFKTASFEAATIEKNAEPGKYVYVAKGKLTMKGVTKDAEFNFNYVGISEQNWDGNKVDVAGFEGRTVINAADFGVGEKNDVTIEFTLEAGQDKK